MLPSRLIALTMALSSATLVAGCGQNPDDGPVDVYLSQVYSAGRVEVTVDDEPMTVQLAGADFPASDECVADEAQRALEDAMDGELRMTTVSKGSTRLVTLKNKAGQDVVEAAVAKGVAVPQLKNGTVPDNLQKNQDDALAHADGFYDPSITCTFAHEYAEAIAAVEQAPTETQPQSIAAADDNIATIVGALAAAKALNESLEAGNTVLRLAAYGTTRLTAMTTRITARSARLSRVLEANRSLRAKLVAEKRQREAERRAAAEAARRAAEAARRAAAAAAARDSYDPPSSSSSSSGSDHSGYTGPRCYAPGGKTWRPC